MTRNNVLKGNRKVKRYHRGRVRSIIVSSPDSEIVASYLSTFEYRPERSYDILSKYTSLIGATPKQG